MRDGIIAGQSGDLETRAGAGYKLEGAPAGLSERGKHKVLCKGT